MGNFIAKLVVWALRSKRLTGEQKTLVTNALLDNIHAVPIRSIITFDQYGTLYIGGRKLEPEQAMAFVESARALRDNHARKILSDQIAFEALKIGLHQGINSDTIMFSKAALWNQEEEQKLLASIVTG